jgi:hypothetical protein
MADGVFNPMTDLPAEHTPGNPYIEQNDIADEVALLLNGFAKRCTKCRRACRLKYLDKAQLCPDCRS